MVSIDRSLVLRGTEEHPEIRENKNPMTLSQARDEAERQQAPTVGGSRWHRKMEPLRVLQVINRIWMGGTEYALLNIMSSIDKKLFEHRICTLRGYDPAFPRMSLVEGKTFVAGQHNGNLQMAVFRLARIMRRYRPHIVHSRNWGAIEAIFAARLAGVPVVIHSEHGYEVEMLKGLPFRQRVLRRAAYALADSVFTVTRELRDFHTRQAWISPDKIRVIYNGVDTQRFSPCTNTRVREEFDIPPHRLVIGTVGRMVPIKDHRTLLQAFELLVAGGVDAHLLLVGSGPLFEAHQAYAKDSRTIANRVYFTGRCDNVPEMLQAMDIFVLPSICEGMSNTLLEAMASGLPAVATRVGGNSEVVDDGRTGWLVSPGNAEELSHRLRLLCLNRECLREAGVAARERAVRQFSLERMASDYQNLYLELTRRRGLDA
jgi:sugar transferase (PEP-CTERM/EpsH1 system associated)